MPSLTEDEEIALAIDSIVEAAKGHCDTPDLQSLCAEEDIVFVEQLEVDVPEAFRDDDSSNATAPSVGKTDSERLESLDEPPQILAESTPLESSPNTSSQQEAEGEVKVSRPEAQKEVRFEEQEEQPKAASCAVISTIPKCDHLTDDDDFGKCEEPAAAAQQQQQQKKRRARVTRSQSEMSHCFEVGPAEKHGRHLTSNGETFSFALNPNLGEAATKRIAMASSIAASGACPSAWSPAPIAPSLGAALRGRWFGFTDQGGLLVLGYRPRRPGLFRGFQRCDWRVFEALSIIIMAL